MCVFFAQAHQLCHCLSDAGMRVCFAMHIIVVSPCALSQHATTAASAPLFFPHAPPLASTPKHHQGKEIKKVIFVPGKILNLIVPGK